MNGTYPFISTGKENDEFYMVEKNDEEDCVEKNPWNMVARSTSTLGEKNHEYSIIKALNSVPMEIKG